MIPPGCQAHEGCAEPVVARVGLPGPRAMWVCAEGFLEFQGNPRCGALVGGDRGARCTRRASHVAEGDGWHEHHGTRWR